MPKLPDAFQLFPILPIQFLIGSGINCGEIRHFPNQKDTGGQCAQQHPGEQTQAQQKQLHPVVFGHGSSSSEALPGRQLRMIQQNKQCAPVAKGHHQHNDDGQCENEDQSGDLLRFNAEIGGECAHGNGKQKADRQRNGVAPYNQQQRAQNIQGNYPQGNLKALQQRRDGNRLSTVDVQGDATVSGRQKLGYDANHQCSQDGKHQIPGACGKGIADVAAGGRQIDQKFAEVLQTI